MSRESIEYRVEQLENAAAPSSTFLDLTDTPASYSGQGLKVVRVNSGATALEFVTLAGGGDLLAANNLSDLANVATARTNLGLNTTANQTDSTDKRFMTDAQETKLDGLTQYTDELAQDAVGAMVANSTFVDLTYVDGTPSLTPALSATGTADNTTFLRGDNTWATPAAADPAGWTTIVKSANQDVTNNATLQDDTELQFSVVAGGYYMVEMDVVVSMNNNTGRCSLRLDVSSGTMKGMGVMTHINATSAAQITAMTASNAANVAGQIISSASADIDQLVSLKIIYSFWASANATFIYKFANTTAGVGRTSRTWKGSILNYKRID